MNHTCTCDTGTSCSKQLNIRMPVFDPDPMLARVLHTLEILRESRFGDGRNLGLIYSFSEIMEPDDDVIFDDWDGEVVPSYDFFPHDRFGSQVVEAAYRKAKQRAKAKARPKAHRAVAAATATTSPANQGRGSPF